MCGWKRTGGDEEITVEVWYICTSALAAIVCYHYLVKARIDEETIRNQ